MVGSIILDGTLSCCDLKATQINMQCSPIQKLMLYKYKLAHNATETTKNICCSKILDLSTITRWFNKFHSSCKNLNDQARSSRPRIIDFKAKLQAISQSNMFYHFHELNKSIRSCRIVLHINVKQNSPRPVAIPRLKSPVYPTIFL